MRLFRMFMLPLCLGLLTALAVFSPTKLVDGDVGVSAAYEAVDFMIAPADFDRAIIIAERSHVAAPADAHLVAYTIANQPLSTWRVAADAYRHIDPGRMLV